MHIKMPYVSDHLWLLTTLLVFTDSTQSCRSLHENLGCSEPCRKILVCGHGCANMCGQDCQCRCEAYLSMMKVRESFSKQAEEHLHENLEDLLALEMAPNPAVHSPAQNTQTAGIGPHIASEANGERSAVAHASSAGNATAPAPEQVINETYKKTKLVDGRRAPAGRHNVIHGGQSEQSERGELGGEGEQGQRDQQDEQGGNDEQGGQGEQNTSASGGDRWLIDL